MAPRRLHRGSRPGTTMEKNDAKTNLHNEDDRCARFRRPCPRRLHNDRSEPRHSLDQCIQASVDRRQRRRHLVATFHDREGFARAGLEGAWRARIPIGLTGGLHRRRSVRRRRAARRRQYRRLLQHRFRFARPAGRCAVEGPHLPVHDAGLAGQIPQCGRLVGRRRRIGRAGDGRRERRRGHDHRHRAGPGLRIDQCRPDGRSVATGHQGVAPEDLMRYPLADLLGVRLIRPLS
ncbi:hypothetical protein BN2475_190243 [Paraburkholderia ribeironis]|uniref:Uncharacterized protein n=1 Tax=Paraburkholderia ribeironis TaxID=1247936 RepID=A0A1N7RWD4_9BURK|nr:hypothetical protein BN2475_190243 [Paraburkholderia ribeironis]